MKSVAVQTVNNVAVQTDNLEDLNEPHLATRGSKKNNAMLSSVNSNATNDTTMFHSCLDQTDDSALFEVSGGISHIVSSTMIEDGSLHDDDGVLVDRRHRDRGVKGRCKVNPRKATDYDMVRSKWIDNSMRACRNHSACLLRLESMTQNGTIPHRCGSKEWTPNAMMVKFGVKWRSIYPLYLRSLDVCHHIQQRFDVLMFLSTITCIERLQYASFLTCHSSEHNFTYLAARARLWVRFQALWAITPYLRHCGNSFREVCRSTARLLRRHLRRIDNRQLYIGYDVVERSVLESTQPQRMFTNIFNEEEELAGWSNSYTPVETSCRISYSVTHHFSENQC